MVSLSWAFIAFGFGLLLYLLPALLAPGLPAHLQQTVVDKYQWLTAMSLWRPTLVRRELGGYSLTYRSFDKEKRQDEVDDDLDIHDPDNRISRWAGKPFAGVYEDTPVAVDADLAELGEHHHEHVEADRHKIGDDKVNPYVEVEPEMQLADLANAYHVIPNAADPSDPETIQSYIARAMSKYRGRLSKTEAMLGMLGFLAGLGGVVFLQRYILKSSGAGGTGEPPIPIGVVDVGLDAALAVI